MVVEVSPEFIKTIDSVLLVRLMKRLMLAKCRLTDIPFRAASVPLQVTVPDGSEDGRVGWTGGVDSTAYFPHRLTLFQSKAQDLTEGRIRGEFRRKLRVARPQPMTQFCRFSQAAVPMSSSVPIR